LDGAGVELGLTELAFLWEEVAEAVREFAINANSVFGFFACAKAARIGFAERANARLVQNIL
jgi:hypothetical protein